MLKEFSDLFRDRWSGARNLTSFSLSAILSLLLVIQGNPYVFTLGVYIFVSSIIVINSGYVLLAKDKDKALFVGSKEKYSLKYHSLRPVAIGTISVWTVFTLGMIFIPPINGPFRVLVNGTPTSTPTSTSTPTQTPTNTLTARPTFTASSTATPTLVVEATYYMIVLDASELMSESFHGQSKWDLALHSARTIIDGLNPHAKFGLAVVGGSNSSGFGDPCGDPSTLAVSFSTHQAVREHLDQLGPQGGGSLYTAYTIGKNQLEELPPGAIKTLIFITGSSDACDSGDEWADINRINQITPPVDMYSEIIILEEDGLKTETIEEQLEGLPENVKIQIPETVSEVEETNNIVINNVTNYIEEYIAITSPGPIGPVLVSPPSPTSSIALPSNTAPPAFTRTFTPPPPILTNTPIYIPPDTSTSTPTNTPTITPIPTFTWTTLTSQTDVFSPGCPIINDARVFIQFYQGQASITSALFNGHTGKGLRLDFFNTSSEGGNYAGWEVRLGVDDYSGIDLSPSSSYSSLVFYIRGKDGGEEPNVYLMMPILDDYMRYWKDVELVSPITTTWQQIVIPLSHFETSQDPHQQVDLSNIQRIQFLFEWYSQPTSGTIYIDDLCVQ